MTPFAASSEGDELTHAILTKLNQTFITPFDREDIHQLASKRDDVLDFINASGARLVMYRIATPPPAAADLARIIMLPFFYIKDTAFCRSWLCISSTAQSRHPLAV